MTDLFGIEPLQGTYGRTYKNAKALEKDWLDGKDFRCVNGQMCSIRDFGENVKIEARYGKHGEHATVIQGRGVGKYTN
jgi:hypothetical protein